MVRRERPRSNGRRGSGREAVPKASEEKALEGRTPRRARSGRPARKRHGRPFPFPDGENLWSRARAANAARGNDRRGAVPERGPAGREEQGPEGRTPRTLRRRRPSRGSGGRKPPRGYANPEGGRCRGVEPPGEPDPPCHMCRRGRNPRRVVLPPSGGGGRLRSETSRTGQAHDGARPRESASSPRTGRPQGLRRAQGERGTE